MARASLLHYHQSFADPSFYDDYSQSLQPAVGPRQNTSRRSQLIGSHQHMQAMAQPYSQQYKSDRGLNLQQWQQYQAYMQSDGEKSGHQATAGFPRDRVWTDGVLLNNGLAMSGKPHMPPTTPQVDGSYGNGALVYSESASRLGANGVGGCAVPWPTPESFSHSGSASDAFDRGIDNSLSPKSYDSETQPSEAQPFTPKSIPSAASNIGDWSCGSAQPYTAIKASPPNTTTWGFENDGGVNLSCLPQHGLDMHVPMAPSIGSSQGFNGLPAIYSDASQHGSDYSYSQHSSPSLSSGFHGGPSHNAAAYRSNNFLTGSAPFQGLSNQGQARTSNGISAGSTFTARSHRSMPRRENDQAPSGSESAADTHAQRRADDAILLEGKRNGLTYKDISKKMHKKCAESTLRGRYRSLTKARQDRVRKPVWRQKDIELLTDFVTRDLDRIDASFHHSLTRDQRLAKVQWKKVADAVHRNGGSYHFGNATCKKKWVEIRPER